MLAVPLLAVAQPVEQVRRIGMLRSGSAQEPDRSVEAFWQGLRDLGWVEGQNLVMEYRWAEGKDERLPDLAAALVRLQVEVIVAGGPPAIRAAQHATRTIPIVMTGTADPVAEGFVASLAQPGDNITGVSLLMVELPGKRLEFLKEIVPQSTRVAVLANPAFAVNTLYLHNLTVAAQALGMYLHVVEVRRADELDAAFAAITRADADALMVLSDPALMDSLLGRVAALAATHRLPAMYNWKMYVEAGGLMSYGPSLPERHRRAATYVDKILKGAKPADLPVEQPMKFDFVINLKAATQIGLTIPPNVLARADRVIR
jgi:putative ABC transport system substrate-binding protein